MQLYCEFMYFQICILGIFLISIGFFGELIFTKTAQPKILKPTPIIAMTQIQVQMPSTKFCSFIGSTSTPGAAYQILSENSFYKKFEKYIK